MRAGVTKERTIGCNLQQEKYSCEQSVGRKSEQALLKPLWWNINKAKLVSDYMTIYSQKEIQTSSNSSMFTTESLNPIAL